MAKIITYELKTAEGDRGAACSMPYSEENLKLAEAEAFGEVKITDDGQPEPEVPASTEDRIAAMEAKFAAMEAAYTEGVTEA